MLLPTALVNKSGLVSGLMQASGGGGSRRAAEILGEFRQSYLATFETNIRNSWRIPLLELAEFAWLF